VVFIGGFRHQQHEKHATGLAVRRFELHRGGEAEKGTDGFLQTLDAPVGNGDALAEAGGAQFLAGEQAS
jgi:hypothetical protein